MSNQVLENKLKEFFGYNTFRNHQKEIIEAVLDRKDVIAILPTGAGKSLCYQLPAMLMAGTAIVVSPLISLMQDQVVSLFKNGIPAAFLNSSLYYQDIQNVLDHLSDYKLIYIAPERFADPIFLQRLKEIEVSFFVIDEAHCISQWGHSFRNEYRKLSLLKEHFPTKPVMALTATATSEVEKDMIQQLAMKNQAVIKGSFDRPNLTIRINQKMNLEKQLREFLDLQQGKSGIIYAATRKTVDATYEQLKNAGYSVNRYHAGMTDQDRMISQNEFLHDHVQLMVATVAFGMGIHKPDIRFIVHLDMPRSIEQYYQEIGRAGRDGLPAECLMLYGAQDIIVYKVFLDELEDPIIRKQTKMKTEKMYSLCTSIRCRRIELLHYFGELYFAKECLSCDNCIDETNMMDGTIIAQKILSCVFRLRQNFGIRTVIEVLRGSKNQNILERGFDRLSTYGLLSDLPEKEVRYYVESLIHMGILTLTESEYPVLRWTESSRAVIDGQKEILFKKKIFKEAKAIKENVNITLNYDEKAFEELRQLRADIAREENVPPYVVFSDRALQEMAVYFPRTQQEFGRINGVGPIKWFKYGERFLTKIQELTVNRPALNQEKVYSPMQRKQSTDETIHLYKSGYSIEQIMESRKLAKSTILTHLEEGIQKGEQVDISRLVDPDKRKVIEQAIDKMGYDKLTPIKQQLPSEFTYDEIRLVAAFYRR